MTYPKYTANKPKTKLIPMYSKAVKNCPFCINIRFSPENVEKVVKPPQTPTIKKSLKSADMISLLAEIPIINPIRKLPKTFTVNVPMGTERKCQ